MQDIIDTHDNHIKFNSVIFWNTIKTLHKVCNNMQKNQADPNNLHSELVSVQHLFQNIVNADI